MTLDNLREVLVERFGDVLDTPSQPVTWDPSRVARDQEGFAALATYGHPRLDDTLARRSGLGRPGDSALVVCSNQDGWSAAVRADRTPVEVVGRSAEIDTLGTATARGDAERLANSLIAQAASTQQEYETQILAARRHQQIETWKRRFIALVHDTLAAGCAASRYGGEPGADPITIWHDLGISDGWSYAEAFRQRIGVPLARLVPGDLASAVEQLPPDIWADKRRRNGDELQNLTNGYRRAITSS